MTASPHDPAADRPPPRLWWARRSLFVGRAAARPWLYALAALGAAAVAFPVWDLDINVRAADAAMLPAGPMVAVAGPVWPHPQRVAVGWAFKPGGGAFEWVEPRAWPGVDRFDYGLWEPGEVAGLAARPPGAAADLVSVLVSVWWLLGPLAAWSAFAGWRAVRVADDDPPPPPSRDRRLVRPWVVVFSLVGAGLMLHRVTIPDAGGRSGTAFECVTRRTSAGAWHPREVVATVSRGPLPAGAGPAVWGRRGRVGLWWLVAAAVAGNLFTLARFRRGGGGGTATAGACLSSVAASGDAP